MKDNTRLENDILNITLKIHSEFPELCKYIAEMPESKPEFISSEAIGRKDLKKYFNSLEKLVLEYSKTHITVKTRKDETLNSKEDPLYPPSEDMYKKGEKEIDINPEDVSKKKPSIDLEISSNEKILDQYRTGKDLDVPGSELDDQQESVGS